MKNKILLLLAYTLISVNLQGQGMEELLRNAALNNPRIIAYGKLLEARKAESKTGIAPADPFISGSYMPGQDATPGRKKTWEISQSFSFPTKYLLQKQMSKSTVLLAEQEFGLGRMQILLDAELSFLDLVYNSRMLTILQQRKNAYDELRNAWEKMLDSGAATIMDYNRILIELSQLNLRITRVQADIEMLNEKIRYITGNKLTLLFVKDYPAFPQIEIDQLINDKLKIHPAYLIPEMEYQISLQNVKLARNGSLPDLQIGYGAELVPGENYSGPVGGLSVPLWSNSNKVKAASAQAEHVASLRDAEILRLVSEVRNEYSNMKALQTSLNEIRNIVDTGESKRLLDKALDAGEISLTTYFSYIESLNASEDRYLQTENELFRSMATLTDHLLLNY
ncbi:MAG TPA: TolC family protein [Bacteroidales bacterium]|nr:TolC family protein [Bacteroidales bacterium]